MMYRAFRAFAVGGGDAVIFELLGSSCCFDNDHLKATGLSVNEGLHRAVEASDQTSQGVWEDSW